MTNRMFEVNTMKSKITIVAIALFALSSWAADSALVSATERTFDALEQRVKVLSDRVDEMSVRTESFVSNYLVTITGEYESRLKTRVDKIDEEIGDAVKDKEFYSKRYAELKAEYADAYKNLRDDYDKFVGKLEIWLTVIGILVALIGIFVPAFATFAQWKNIKAGLTDLKQGKDKELSNLRKDGVRALHMSLLQGVQNIDAGVPLSTIDKANVIYSMVICFDDLLECAMRTKDCNMVKDEVAAFRPFLSRWSDSNIAERIDIWAKSEMLLKAAMKGRTGLSRREAFVELLGENSETFKWLEAFYRKFAAWKFA